jgi:DMSO/TMAO reductase YedYZ molybdopterin-dependent catalytic subunit
MLDRRELLRLGAAALTAWPVARARADSLLVHVGSPQDLGTPLSYFDRLLTPTAVFFVRSHFGPPALDPERPLRISGIVHHSLELRAGDLRGFPEVTLTAVLQCAGNGRSLHRPRVPGVQWVHGAMGQATWTGVRLADLLGRAGLGSGATHLRIVGADLPPKPAVPAFVRGLPIARALDPTTLVAYRMNGEPLTLAHGAPLRLVVPGWAGDHWVKWLREIRVQREDAEGFYMQTAYRMPVEPVAPGAAVPPAKMTPLTVVPVKSVISRPRDGGRLQPGPREVVGVCFSGVAPMARVEVSLDGGKKWQPATLEGPGGIGRWQVFRFRADLRPGRYEIVARATDARGSTQPEQAAWNPSGYVWNAWHRVSVQVVG